MCLIFIDTGDPRALFELREKRGKDAQEWFEHQYSDGGPWDPGEDANESNSEHDVFGA